MSSSGKAGCTISLLALVFALRYPIAFAGETMTKSDVSGAKAGYFLGLGVTGATKQFRIELPTIAEALGSVEKIVADCGCIAELRSDDADGSIAIEGEIAVPGHRGKLQRIVTISLTSGAVISIPITLFVVPEQGYFLAARAVAIDHDRKVATVKVFGVREKLKQLTVTCSSEAVAVRFGECLPVENLPTVFFRELVLTKDSVDSRGGVSIVKVRTHGGAGEILPVYLSGRVDNATAPYIAEELSDSVIR